MNIRICDNCQHFFSEVYNMVGMVNTYCKKGVKDVRWNKRADANNCEMFCPTLKISNTFFLKEIYDNFISYHGITFDKHIPHYWRIVDDTKRYKRVSGNRHFAFRFNTEAELDMFYTENKELLSNCNLRYFSDKK